MRLPLALAASALLTWQAATAVIGMVHGVQTRAAIAWDLRLTATTDERIRRVLGGDAELLFDLRAAAAPGALLIGQKVEGRVEDIRSVADFERLSQRNGLLLQLTTLLYPDPFLLVTGNPMQVVEDLVRDRQESTLFVLSGDAAPGSRTGWSLARSSPQFQLWRFRKE